VREDLAAEPLQMQDGYLIPSEKPGFGFQPDARVLEKYCLLAKQVA